ELGINLSLSFCFCHRFSFRIGSRFLFSRFLFLDDRLTNGRVLTTHDGDQPVKGLFSEYPVCNRVTALRGGEELTSKLRLLTEWPDHLLDLGVDLGFLHAEFFRLSDLPQSQRLLKLPLGFLAHVVAYLLVGNLL